MKEETGDVLGVVGAGHDTFQSQEAKEAAIRDRREAVRLAQEALVRGPSEAQQTALQVAQVMLERAVNGTIVFPKQ